MNKGSKSCDLCDSTGGELLWENSECRVVRVDDIDYPGFCRVIWKAHLREMTDLEPSERHALMEIIFTVERVIRELFAPHKINLASFGNMTPHLHWHVIPRWLDDPHFPEPIWGKVHREIRPIRPLISNTALIEALKHGLTTTDSQKQANHE